MSKRKNKKKVLEVKNLKANSQSEKKLVFGAIVQWNKKREHLGKFRLPELEEGEHELELHIKILKQK